MAGALNPPCTPRCRRRRTEKKNSECFQLPLKPPTLPMPGMGNSRTSAPLANARSSSLETTSRSQHTAMSGWVPPLIRQAHWSKSLSSWGMMDGQLSGAPADEMLGQRTTR